MNRHIVEPISPSECYLIDDIEYALPMGALLPFDDDQTAKEPAQPKAVAPRDPVGIAPRGHICARNGACENTYLVPPTQKLRRKRFAKLEYYAACWLASCRCTQERFHEEFSRPCGRHHRRGFGHWPRIAHAILPIAGKGSSDWQYAWVPVVAPLIGGALGGVLIKIAS